MRSDIFEQAQALRQCMDVAAGYLTDEQAARAPLIYPKWEVGEAVAAGERRYYAPRLYKCIVAHTTQEDWTPDLTPSMWVVLDVAHAGTVDDPIPAARGMEYTYGLYYLDENVVYLCYREGESGTVTLQYLPHELVGTYFVEVVE